MIRTLIDGVPVDGDDIPKKVRLVKINDKICKSKWYSDLAGKMIKVYFYNGYKDARSVSMTLCAPISSDDFTLVKYKGSNKNDDFRQAVIRSKV